MAEFRSEERFGMDKEIYEREQAKRDPQVEFKVKTFLEALSGMELGDDLLASCCDGVAICEAMNTVKPGSIKRINQSSMPFKQMENISNFLKACRTELGMSESDLFTVPDLFDKRSIVNFCSGIVSFSRAANKNGFKGASIAPKESKRNSLFKRWSLSKSKSSADVPKLSMGSHGIMKTDAPIDTRSATFGSKAAGNMSNPNELGKFGQGSRGIMDVNGPQRPRDITFGADAGSSKKG